MKTRFGQITLFLAAIACLPLIAFAVPVGKLEGKPELVPKKAHGAFVWHDQSGFHVRFSTTGGTHYFHGKVCSRIPLSEVAPFQLEGEDKALLDSNKNCVVFAVRNHGVIDGFDFDGPAKYMQFDMKINHKTMPTKRIYLGGDVMHPTENPFIVSR